jgi:hypothetical protein
MFLTGTNGRSNPGVAPRATTARTMVKRGDVPILPSSSIAQHAGVQRTHLNERVIIAQRVTAMDNHLTVSHQTVPVWWRRVNA